MENLQLGVNDLSAGTTRAQGEVVFSNSNGVSFGVSGQTITASAGAGGGAAISAGSQSVSSGTVIFSNSNAVTFGMSGSQTVTASVLANSISSATTVQDVGSSPSVGADAGRYALELHQHRGVAAIGVSTGGNTAGNTATTVGTVVFAGGNNVTLSQSTAAGGLATISILDAVSGSTVSDVTTAGVVGTRGSRFAMEDHQHRGVRSVAAQGTATTFFGDVVLSAGTNISLSTGGASTAGTIAIHAPAPTVRYYANFEGGTWGVNNNTILQDAVQIFAPIRYGEFPGNMTVGTMTLFWSANASGASSSIYSVAHTQRYSFGIYGYNNSTQLTLLASVSTSITAAANANNSSLYHGNRWFTFAGTAFQPNSTLTLSRGLYWLAAWHRRSGINTGSPEGPMGDKPFDNASNFMQGLLGQSTNSTSQKPMPGWGVRTASFSTAMPSVNAFSDISFFSTPVIRPYFAVAATDLGT